MATKSARRPTKRLLQQLPERDFRLIEPHLTSKKVEANHDIWHPGDQAESLFFPCGSTLVSLAVSVDVEHEVHAIAIGNEGVLGSMDRKAIPAYARSSVLIGGERVRLSFVKCNLALRQSPAFRKTLESYSSHLFARILQTAACNASHSNEQRAAKALLAVMERTGDIVPLTHEQLAGMLGVRRSYASRLIDKLKEEGLVETRRGAIVVRDRKGLHSRTCSCTAAIKRHFNEIFFIK